MNDVNFQLNPGAVLKKTCWTHSPRRENPPHVRQDVAGLGHPLCLHYPHMIEILLLAIFFGASSVPLQANLSDSMRSCVTPLVNIWNQSCWNFVTLSYLSVQYRIMLILYPGSRIIGCFWSIKTAPFTLQDQQATNLYYVRRPLPCCFPALRVRSELLVQFVSLHSFYWWKYSLTSYSGDSYTTTGFTVTGTKPTAGNPLGNPAYPVSMLWWMSHSSFIELGFLVGIHWRRWCKLGWRSHHSL